MTKLSVLKSRRFCWTAENATAGVGENDIHTTTSAATAAEAAAASQRRHA